MEQFHGTTIVSVRRGPTAAGRSRSAATARSRSATSSSRRTARKVRKLYHDKVLAGFAGATADAFTLFERFEAKLEKHQGHLVRAAIELTKDWRTDRVLRRLEAMLAVADREASLIITGNGDVLEPEHGIVAIGSGGAYAQAAAKALLDNTELAPRDIVKKSLEIAGDLCIYTNMNHTIETLDEPSTRTTSNMTPQEIVSELDRHIVGQADAKRAVAIALRNRWRRQQVDEKLRDEITPKNILMIGPTGVGKTEIARRLARLADAPFIKVEATKFTEVGYVGKDVDSIIRDLVDMAVKQTRDGRDAQGARARRGRRRGAHPRRAGAAGARRRFGHAPARAAATAPRARRSASGCARARSTTRTIEIELAEAAAAAGNHGPARHGGDDRAAARHVQPARRRASARRAS